MMLVNYEKILNDFDLDFLFQTKFDDFGELINSSAVEQLKQILINYIQDLKLVKKILIIFILYIIYSRKKKFLQKLMNYGKCEIEFIKNFFKFGVFYI